MKFLVAFFATFLVVNANIFPSKYDKYETLDISPRPFYRHEKYQVQTHDPKFVETGDFFKIQKMIFDIFYDHEKFHDSNFKIEEYRSFFLKPEVFERFMHYVKYGFFPKDRIFSLSNKENLEEAIVVFNMFYFVKDHETFFKFAFWARGFLNPDLFKYSFMVAVHHRQDFYGFFVPVPFEFNPFFFVGSDVMDKFYKIKETKPTNTFYKFYDNFTSAYISGDSKLSYFTSDVGLNSYHYFFQINHPFWMSNRLYGLHKEKRGEMFFYFYQQMLARYYMERLANNFGEIPKLSWNKPFTTPFGLKLKFFNGAQFPLREDHYKLFSRFYSFFMNDVRFYENFLTSSIDKGFFIHKHKKELLSTESLGRFIKGDADFGFYKFVPIFSKFLSSIGYDIDSHIPSVLDYPETAFKDPFFFKLYKHFMSFFHQYKNTVVPYTKHDLHFPENFLKITDVKFTDLVTFFADYTYDVKNGFFDTYTNEYKFFATQKRLNHKPFSYTLEVHSDKEVTGSVRLFIAPKFGVHGHEYSIEENRFNFVELDFFKYHFVVGKNVITKKDFEFFHTSYNHSSFYDVYENIQHKSKEFFDKSTHHYFPQNLILPKGSDTGMFYKFFVVVTPFLTPSRPVKESFYNDYFSAFYEDRPLGFPFDRVIDERSFLGDNMFYHDLQIFHKDHFYKQN